MVGLAILISVVVALAILIAMAVTAVSAVISRALEGSGVEASGAIGGIRGCEERMLSSRWGHRGSRSPLQLWRFRLPNLSLTPSMHMAAKCSAARWRETP